LTRASARWSETFSARRVPSRAKAIDGSWERPRHAEHLQVRRVAGVLRAIDDRGREHRLPGIGHDRDPACRARQVE